MSMQTQGQVKALSTPKPSFTPVQTGLLQRKCACGGNPGVDGECKECRERRLSLQRRVANQEALSTVPPIVHEVLRSPGQPLDPATRAFMEPWFGHDFSRVRVHTDARSSESAQAMNALAYMVGQDVVFGAGQYEPGTIEGKRLMAHELAHVVQQGEARCLPGFIQMGNTTDNALEAEANLSAMCIGDSLDSTGGMLTGVAQNIRPHLRSGPRLQRQMGEKAEADKKRLEEIKTILNSIPNGKEALKIMEDYKVTVRFEAGQGLEYDPNSNSVLLNSYNAPTSLALTLVHEMNHARYHHQGIAANAKSLAKSKYIEKRVEEEAEGVVKSIEAKIELEGTKIDTSQISRPVEKEYREAYQVAINSAKAKNPKAAERDLQKLGREGGKKRVIEELMSGRVSAGITGVSYPDFYGRIWDHAH